jgi:hypothetical protein
MERPRLGKPADCQKVHAGPREPMRLAAIEESPPPESSHPFPKDTQAIQISRHRVVVEVASHDRLEPLTRLRHRVVHTPAKLLLDLLALIRLPLVLRFTVKYPFCVVPLMCVKPRKSNVSGLPSPLRFRRSSAYRPNSIRRVLSGWSSKPNFCSRFWRSSRKRSASGWYWKPRTLSSA